MSLFDCTGVSLHEPQFKRQLHLPFASTLKLMHGLEEALYLPFLASFYVVLGA